MNGADDLLGPYILPPAARTWWILPGSVRWQCVKRDTCEERASGGPMRGIDCEGRLACVAGGRRIVPAMRLAVLAGLLAIGACGDNLEPEEEMMETPCVPDALTTLVPGPFDDPLALPLPASCVEGGLRDLPGRWWVNVPGESFSFSYPKFEGTCESGFRRAQWIAEDADDADGITFQTWSDGTRFYTRRYARFELPNQTFEFADVFAACMLSDGTLATVNAQYDTDRGQRFQDGVGERFERKDALASGLSLVGELRGNRYLQVAVDGTHAYLAGQDGLDVVDVSNPAEPALVGHVDGQFNDVKLARGNNKLIAYLAPLDNESTKIVDVTEPSAPVQTGTIPAYSHSLFVTPETTPPRLYLGNYSESVPVYDITNPSIPTLAASVPISGSGEEAGIHDIHVDGTRIYADKTIDGVVAVDVASGFGTPVELGRIGTSYSHATWAGVAGGRKIAIHGDEGMTPTEGGAFLRVIDADEASPTFMQVIGRYQSRKSVGIHNMILVGDRAYIAYYQDGIRVLDLSNPTQPREVAHYNTFDVETAPGQPFEGAVGLAIVGDLIYVADDLAGLVVLRIDD